MHDPADMFEHASRRLLYTSGIAWMVRHAANGHGARWLLDAVASHQADDRVAAHEFQVWTLRVAPDRSAVLTMQTDSGEPPMVTQAIPTTDYDEPICEMLLIRTPGQPAVLMLASEY